MQEQNPITLFNRWFKIPLIKLEEIDKGDGGFVVCATSFFLYERYASATKDNRGMTVKQCFADDFMLNPIDADLVYETLRNGFLHQGMPFLKTGQGKINISGWGAANEYPMFEVDRTKVDPFIKFNPWKFRDKVLDLFEKNPQAISANTSALFGQIYEEKSLGGSFEPSGAHGYSGHSGSSK